MGVNDNHIRRVEQLVKVGRNTFLVLTDHKRLEYIKKAKRLNPCRVNMFNFMLLYRPVSQNIKPVTVLRRFNPQLTVKESFQDN